MHPQQHTQECIVRATPDALQLSQRVRIDRIVQALHQSSV